MKAALRALVAICSVMLSDEAMADGVLQVGPPPEPTIQWLAIVVFMAFVSLTLVITYVAAKRTGTTEEFYSAGGNLTGFQNGMAIAGDWMSAATFLGMSGLVFTFGLDGIVYAIGAAISWPVIMFILSDRVRNLGRHTYMDVIAFRLDNVAIRTLGSFSGLTIIFLYLTAQMVGAGALIQILFGLPYWVAVVLVGVLMSIYVSFGGMLATSWIQIIKAAILLVGGTLLGTMALSHFDFSLDQMLDSARAASPLGEDVLLPGNLLKDPVAAISLGLAFLFGPAGLPHILMRFYTVPDGRTARQSVSWASLFIAYFQIVVFLIGLAAITLLAGQSQYFGADGKLIGGANMAALHLSDLLGGQWLLGVVSAVTFATIIAVVAGLTLSAASTFSHDIYATVIARGRRDEKREILISRLATIAVGVVAIGLGILFEKQNVAFMATLSLAVAASVNFSLLFLSLFWSGLTTRGTVWGGAVGLVSSITMVCLSAAVWVDILGNAQAIFPYPHPTIFSLPLTLLVAIVVSMLDKSPRAQAERAAYRQQLVISEMGQAGAKTPSTDPSNSTVI